MTDRPYRVQPYVWPDGSSSPGVRSQTYAEACVEYERRRRSVSRNGHLRETAILCSDGLGGYVVSGIAEDARRAIRGGVGNVWPPEAPRYA